MSYYLRSTILFIVILPIVLFLLTVMYGQVINFKVDAQTVGQEEYDRFILMEQILSAEGCTLQRGIYRYDKVNSSDERCQFQTCTIPAEVDWGYTLQSQELNLSTKTCTKGTQQPRFRFSQAVPVVLYKEGRYYPANLMVYGPEGVISTALSGGRSKTVTREEFFQKDLNKGGVTEVSASESFTCDAPEVQGAYCVLTSMTTTAEIRTGGRNADINHTLTVDGAEFQVTDPQPHGQGPLNVQDKWEAQVNLAPEDIRLEPGQAESLNMQWSYHYQGGLSPSCPPVLTNCQLTRFGTVGASITYRVVCPPGMTVKTDNPEDAEPQFRCVEEERNDART